MKKCKHYSYLLMFFALYLANTVTLSAQFPTPAEMEKMKNRKMLVLVEQPEEEIIARLEKADKGLIAIYKERLETYNSNLKTALQTFWTFQEDVKFVSIEEIKEIKKSKSKEYTVIFTTSISYSGSTAHDIDWSDDLIKASMVDYHKYTQFGTIALAVALIEDYGERTITSMPSNRYLPTKTEMACMVYTMNSILLGEIGPPQITLKDIDKNCPGLKTKTLLINKSNLSDQLSEEKLKSIYPYGLRVLDDKEIDELVFSKTPGIAYLYAYPIYLFNTGYQYMVYMTINFGETKYTQGCLVNPLDFMINKADMYDQYDAKIVNENAISAIVNSIK